MDQDGSDSAMIDVSGMSILELLTSREPAIADALRRLLSERRKPRNVLLGWQSAHLPPPVGTDSAEDQRHDPAL